MAKRKTPREANFTLDGEQTKVRMTKSKINKGNTTKWVLKPIAKEVQ